MAFMVVAEAEEGSPTLIITQSHLVPFTLYRLGLEAHLESL